MKREESYFAKGKALANFSLLYPKGADISVGRQNPFLGLDPAAAHDLRLEGLIIAFAPERRHQKEIRELFSRLPIARRYWTTCSPTRRWSRGWSLSYP